MGIDRDFTTAFAKAQLGAGTILPTAGTVFVSVKDSDKPVDPAGVARAGRCRASRSSRPAAPRIICAAHGVPVERVNKVAQGRPHIVDRINDGEIDADLQHHRRLADPEGLRSRSASRARRSKIPYFTTAPASVEAARGDRRRSPTRSLEVRPLAILLFALAQLIPDSRELMCGRSLQGRLGTGTLRRTRGMATVEKMPMLQEGYEKLTRGSEAAEDGTPADRRRDRGSARARRPVGKRRISCRQGAAGPERGDDLRYRGQAEPRADHRSARTCRATRSCSARPSRCSTRTTSRSSYQIVGQTEADAKHGPDLLQFAARPRADRAQASTTRSRCRCRRATAITSSARSSSSEPFRSPHAPDQSAARSLIVRWSRSSRHCRAAAGDVIAAP